MNQTDGDAAESFTVSTSDLDPGMLHVEMRGSEFTALTSIKSDYLNDVTAKIGGLQTAASDAQGFEGALTAAEEARDVFFNNATASDPSGSGAVFSTSGDIDVEASRVEGIAAELSRLEDVSSDAQDALEEFFGDAGPGRGFATSQEIADEALRLEGLAEELVDDAADEMSHAASALRDLETQAQALEDAASDAQGMVDNFFADGEGSEFADRSAMDTAISDLRGLEGQGQIAEGNIVTAQDNLAFFSGLNSDSALNLKDGTVYTVSGDIADEAAALETLLNDDEDAVYSADRVTGFLESQDRAIADLDDLNGQIDHSVVMREMSVSDAAPQLVSLDEAEVDRLGEGSVQIEARQTDAVGNVHEGGPATSSFVIDTIDPSTLDAPAVTLGLVTDADDGTTLTVTSALMRRWIRVLPRR